MLSCLCSADRTSLMDFVVPEQISSNVIPFPRRATELPDVLARVAANLRLQRLTLTEWRATLAVRRDGGGALGAAVQDYRAELADLDCRLVRLLRCTARLQDVTCAMAADADRREDGA